LTGAYPGVPAEQLECDARLYGTRARDLLADAKTTADLGRHFSAGLHAREIDFLMDTE